MGRDEVLDLVRKAARAPTAENTQPARWRFEPSGAVLQFLALDRALPLSDPDQIHLRQGMGATFEGLSLALSEQGRGLTLPEFPVEGEAPAGHRLYVRSSLTNEVQEDSLAPFVEKRRTYRGRFEKATPDLVSGIQDHFGSAEDVRVVTTPDTITTIAQSYDRALYAAFRRKGYLGEIRSWMRFSPSHPNWDRDGLRADCMDLHGILRGAASVILRPTVFKVFSLLGLGKSVLSEFAKIESACALLSFLPEKGTDAFDVGRRFYRLCLEVTALGFCLCPLSSLADDESETQLVCELLSVPSDRRLANVFRVGPLPSSGIPVSSRLPAQELLI